MDFIIRGKGTYRHDYKQREEQHRKAMDKKFGTHTVSMEADPNHREMKKIGNEIKKMKDSGESRERIDNELGREACKHLKT